MAVLNPSTGSDRRTRRRTDLTLEALERLKELGEGLCGELLVVLGGHLDADLKVLPDVGGQHGSQTLQRVLDRQGTEKVHQPLQARHKNKTQPHRSLFTFVSRSANNQ